MSAARYTMPADEFAGSLTAEAMLEVMQADCGYAAAAEFADHLTETFTDTKNVRAVAEAVALELMSWIRPALFPEGPNGTRPSVMYRHPDGLGTIKSDPANGRLVVSNEVAGQTVFVTIGAGGMRDLAAELLALAVEMEGVRDE